MKQKSFFFAKSPAPNKSNFFGNAPPWGMPCALMVQTGVSFGYIGLYAAIAL